MLPAVPRRHYRAARRLLILAPAGLLLAALLPWLLVHARALAAGLAAAVVLWPLLAAWAAFRFRRARREAPERVALAGRTTLFLLLALALWLAGLSALARAEARLIRLGMEAAFSHSAP